MSLDHDIPMVIRRREAKDYGTRQMIEGVYQDHYVCLVVEDVVTSGGSVLETAQELNRVNLICKGMNRSMFYIHLHIFTESNLLSDFKEQHTQDTPIF